jgi:rod shape determining protein RodA
MSLNRWFARSPWKAWIQPWIEMDWLLLILVVGITLLGGIMIRSAELTVGNTNWWQHWLTGGVGLFFALLLARFPYDYLARWKWIIYGITNVSLLAVMLVGTTALGAERWITIGSFNIQPSEFAKVGLILTLAALLQSDLGSTLQGMFKTLAVVSLPAALVFLQPSLGTTLVLGSITMGMLYWGNAKPGWLLLLISPLVSAILFNVYIPVWLGWTALMAVAAWSSLPWRLSGALGALAVNLLSGGLGQLFWGLLKDYQKARITLFLNPDQDPMGGGYHLIQSRIAIGAGELWGQGLNQGTQTQLNFIPEQDTDFIFAAVGEELGFVGAMVVLVCFWLICLRLVMVAQTAKDNFGSLIVIGVLAMIVFQVTINIGMTIGLAPITGIPLPWLSYGRSALLTNFIAIGLVESVANHRQRFRF